MNLVIRKEDLARAVGAVAKVVEARNTIPILSNILLDAGDGKLKVTGTDLDIEASTSVEATVNVPGRLTVNAKLLGDLAKKATGDVTMTLDTDRFIVKYGRSRFTLQTLPAEDFPSLTSGAYTAEFDIDLAALFAPVSFAISTEETRYYLNGVYFRGGDEAVAVATDGHRLAKHVGPTLPAFDGIIVPRKTVGLIPKGTVTVSVSAAKIRIASGDLVLTSKLIDGTFPDYERVIPRSNDKVVTVDRDSIMKAADRVATVSSERGRAVKMTIAPGSVRLVVNSADAGTAEDEIEAEYSGEPLDIGFNAQYVRDVFGTLPAGPVSLALADSGSPALVTGGLDGWTGVLMPMRV
ncbi:DNA polymerase III subunit beta [Shinella sp.]|uniref:DNA polymerase III subunit beta n=1 Tax=Shinella sp. TaxID=1870904 RepID=UPI0028AC4422|nr:DNA polymerase III subunit beta [Shinella sp.]